MLNKYIKCNFRGKRRGTTTIVVVRRQRVKASDARRITAAEMKYMRGTAGYTRTDYRTNAQIAKELKITSILDKLL